MFTLKKTKKKTPQVISIVKSLSVVCLWQTALLLVWYVFKPETLNNVKQLPTSASSALVVSLKDAQSNENNNVNSIPQQLFSRGR